ncbi:fl(2)d-associated complex component-like isoform X2 [Formica exsecta]|uniref:fl(2)d-associated complex component-like isoform X2 n=1 Tax=Formica exsecta TaxID=72781 RepID=UPI001143330F|nr:fl(2)d-associated complex component-like isoform X2 [Formica exsecta]
MPAAGAAVPAVAEGAGQLEDLDEPPEPRARGGGGRTGLMKPLVVLALPGMYLFYKYSQYRREQRELSRRRVTERELQHLHHKICVICVNARATMQTAPCGHRVVCRRCFVKTIQTAVSQRLLPLRCVICRTKILRLKQTLIPRDYSMSGKSWVLPQSASEYNMGTGVTAGVSGPGGRWGTGSVPASASLYSMASGSSSISGVSSVSSATSSSAHSTGSSALGKPTRVRQPIGATLRRSQAQSMKMRIQEYQDPVQQISEEEEIRERRLPPIKEFQRDYRAGKASTRIRCAQKIVTQLETSPSPRVTTSGVTTSTSSSSASSCGRAASKRPASTPKMSVVQEVQKSKKEKEREKEREKAEKARQKEEEKAEKTRQKEAKKLAKEEKKRAKKEAKARRKEAEEALLRDEK